MSPIEDEERVISVKMLGGERCPFRGYPHRYPLDERCPRTIPAVMVEVEDREARVEKGLLVWPKVGLEIPVPVLKNGSYCHECINKYTREKEAGLDVREHKIGKVRRQRRIRRAR